MREQTEPYVVSKVEEADGSWLVRLSDGSESRMDSEGRLFETTSDGSFRAYSGDGVLRVAFGTLP